MGKLPVVGQDVYIETALFLTHGEDDFIGGLCRVSKVNVNGGSVWLEVEEDRGTMHNWHSLKELQAKLKAEFGSRRGYKKPDFRQEFNSHF